MPEISARITRSSTAAAAAAAAASSSIKESAVEERKKGLGSSYEKIREQRIKENLERIKNLGILDLSRQLKKSPSSQCRLSRRALTLCDLRRHQDAASLAPEWPAPPPRRSSRLQNANPVSYVEVHEKKKELSLIDQLKTVGRGHIEEVYTDEHVALLGSCELSWMLFVDGYGSDGKRIYDPINGKTCHQCRQKTLGRHTHCRRCKLVQGQFCGDCLYMRYGENVLEVEKNADWICPVCRGICNCSLCRTKKGWTPTGYLYKKVLNLGYKSVAHYLILTRRGQANSGDQNSAQLPSSDALVPLEAEVSSGTLEIDDGLNSETAYKNTNDSFAVVEVPSHPQESLLPERGPSISSCEEVRTQSAQELRVPRTVKPTGSSKKVKDSAAIQKIKENGIASRLRKRVRSPAA